MLSVLVGGVLGAALALLAFQRSAYPFFWLDLLFYLKLRSFRKLLRARMQRGIVTLLDCFLQRAEHSPHKPFIVFEEQRLTYRDVDVRSNRFANALAADGALKQRDVVALFMGNEPDFICAWFGLCKLDCQTAFINTNTRSAALAPTLRRCGATALIVGADLVGVVEEAWPELQSSKLAVWVMQRSPSKAGFRSLLDTLEQMPAENLRGVPKVDISSNFLFIFTSGTTGLSKAACVGHLKAIMSMAFLHMCGATADDIIYISLPLYHMSASLLGIGGCIHLGATCVLKKKFSATNFWKDCVKHKVTVVQYIGELCRYLVNQPQVPEERAHSVRLAAGSGLRPNVWREFVGRFGVRIREGYGLTEASIGFLNCTDEIGPIGRASYFNKLAMPFDLLKFDPQTYEPIRAASGRCIPAEKGEAGILVAPLSAMNQFPGYAGNKLQSDKKLVKDVFRQGDVYFNTGDLLVQDSRDFLYFSDRVGDTFRWKGENVSTMEVSEALCHLEFIQEANVYGVTVSGNEGRAGMAAIVLKQDHKLDGPRLFSQLQEVLPGYAWPRFVRVQTTLDVTETFKQQKVKLVQEGFDPDVVQDPLYFMDVSQKDYVQLTTPLYQDIICGKAKL